ncbi:MAG: HAMP domain-containing protein, partial [bacterium]
MTTVTLITSYFAYSLHEKSIEKHLKTDAAIATEITENIVLLAMQRKDPEALHRLLPELSKLHHLKRIRVVQIDGRITFSSEHHEEGEVIELTRFGDFIKSPIDTFTAHIVEQGDALFQKWRKIKNREECYECHDPTQEIRGISLVETRDSLSLAGLKPNLYLLVGIPFVIIVLLSMAAQILFVRSVDRPVQKLKAAMNAMQNGNFTHRVNYKNEDELGQLAAGMNSMAKKLQEARKHLTEHHH